MSKNPGLFKDIGKESNDLLNKNFDSYDTKFEVNAAGDNANVKASFTKVNDKTTGSLEYKWKHKSGADLTHTIDFNKSLKTTIVFKDKLIQKLDTTVEVTTNSKLDDVKVKVSGDYAHDVATVGANITVPVSGAGITTVTSVVVGSKERGLTLGSEIELSAARAQLTRVDAAFSYKRGNSALTFFSKTNRDVSNNALNHKFGGNLHYKISAPSCSCNPVVALETVYNPKSSNIDFTLGASGKPGTTSNLKAKVASSGDINVAFTKDLDKPLSLGLYAATSVQNWTDVKLGLKVA